MFAPADTKQLEEAEAELADFGAFMAMKQAQHQAPSSPRSTATPLTESAQDLPEASADMDLDPSREKRLQEATGSPPPTKWKKGDNKGDSKAEGASNNGKGSNLATPTGQAEPSAPSQVVDTRRRQDRGQRSQQTDVWNRQGWQRNSWQGHQGRSREDEVARLREIIRCLARLCLRMEDSLAVTHLDQDFVLFLQTQSSGNKWAVTEDLYSVALDWKEKKSNQPQKLTQPLRNVLIYCLLTCLHNQVQALGTDKALLEMAQKKGLVVDNCFPFLQWDAEAKKHVASTIEPMTHTAVLEHVHLMMKLVTFPSVIGRFHAWRQLSAHHASEVLPFIMTVQTRSQEANQMYHCMARLSRCSCWHLVGCTTRQSKLGRSPLAVQIDKMLQSL